MRDPLTEEDTLVEDPLIEMEGPQEKDILMEVGDPPGRGGYPCGGSPDGGGSPGPPGGQEP